jgi:hypothetical protein
MQTMHQIYSESIDIKLLLIPGEAVDVTIKFDSNVDPSLCEVWGIITYQYPTKSVGETPESLRFGNQLEVDFIFGWKDVQLIPIFVTGFIIRIFYWGEETILVDVTLTRLGNAFSYTGIGLVGFSALQLVIPVMIDKFRVSE